MGVGFVSAAAGSAGVSLRSSTCANSSLFGSKLVRRQGIRAVRSSVCMTATAESTSKSATVKDLFIPEDQVASRREEASSLYKIHISEVDYQWVHVLSEGWASPVKGFMREDEYVQVLHFNSIRQADGTVANMSVPIVLAINDDDKAEIEKTGKVALRSPGGEVIAIMRNCEIFWHNKEERAARSFGVTDGRHPYIDEIYSGGDWLVGGDLEVFDRIRYEDGLDEYRLTPAELQTEFEKRGADTVFVFQLRNPIHNGHALLMTSCREHLLEMGYKNPILLVHQIGGKVKADDIPLKERIMQNQAVLEEGVLDPKTTIVGIFPSPMLYGGPTEVQWHAKARMNAGCEYYIVGRDPAGMKHPNGERDLYDPWHGKKVLSTAPGLEKLNILPFRVAAYDKTIGRMAFFDPSRADDFLFISGTKMRGYASRGETPPDGFMAPAAWKILVDYYSNVRSYDI
uniref:sulfate adenylyltransferase n=1 Tax=Rhodosorus marinus TaxID=101924 RepID=A0A7S0FYS6_9RHOD|mmetsp:Transcript_11785/g.17073  ORF Transcript_11785/g.17073 Transcript_11785/m.17073 type:complete len:456 (+) Transcript_11785:98-1465(+)